MEHNKVVAGDDILGITVDQSICGRLKSPHKMIGYFVLIESNE